MIKYVLISIFFISLLSEAQVSRQEHATLTSFFKKTQGHNWYNKTNWNTSQPVSTWFGVTVTTIDGQEHVYTINLYKNNLTGEIPKELGNLSELTLLNLPQNNLRGVIPDELSAIKTTNFKGNPQLLTKKSNANIPKSHPEKDSNILIKTIYFDYLSNTLNTKALNKLNEAVSVLKEYKNAHIMIEGHSDNQNTETIRQRLSDQRAAIVTNFLVSKGIDEGKITSFRHGGDSPVATNNTLAGRAENRRVEIKVLRPSSLETKTEVTNLSETYPINHNSSTIELMENGIVEITIPYQKKPETSTIPIESYTKTILFEGLEITPAIKTELANVVYYCKNYKNIIYIIEGHTDDQWDADFNLKLSENRANAIKKHLVEQGIAANLILTKGLGSSIPMPSDGSYYNSKKNNRIVIRLQKKLAKKVTPISFTKKGITPIKHTEKKIAPENENDLKVENIDELIIEEEVVEDVPFSIIENAPIYPGCKGDKEWLRKCLSISIQQFVKTIFNTDIAKDLGLKAGKQRIHSQFTIDKEGVVKNITVRAPHEKLKEEALRVIQKLPRMKPGKQRGVPVSVKYALPISFIVQD